MLHEYVDIPHYMARSLFHQDEVDQLNKTRDYYNAVVQSMECRNALEIREGEGSYEYFLRVASSAPEMLEVNHLLGIISRMPHHVSVQDFQRPWAEEMKEKYADYFSGDTASKIEILRFNATLANDNYSHISVSEVQKLAVKEDYEKTLGITIKDDKVLTGVARAEFVMREVLRKDVEKYIEENPDYVASECEGVDLMNIPPGSGSDPDPDPVFAPKMR